MEEELHLEESSLDKSSLGTPGSVLGIHHKNAYARRPKNREERILMKSQCSNFLAGEEIKVGSNKKLAPNNIKKSQTINIVKEKVKHHKIEAMKVKKVSKKEKPVRGVSLYRFTESARTLRSAAPNTDII